MDGQMSIPRKRRFVPIKVLFWLFGGTRLASLKEAREKAELECPDTIACLEKEQSFRVMLNDLCEKESVL